MSNRTVYKYQFKVGRVIVHGGITDNLTRREQEHRSSGRWTPYNGKRLQWKNGHIVQIGRIVTPESARSWESNKGYGPDQHK